MNNLERFKHAINWEPTDRIMTYDLLDNQHILSEHGGYDPTRNYSFEELLEVNAMAWKNSGLDVTRSVYDPVNHWMGGKIVNWIRFFGVNPDNWAVDQTGGTAWIAKRPFTRSARAGKAHAADARSTRRCATGTRPRSSRCRRRWPSTTSSSSARSKGPITDAYSYMDMELFCQRDLRGAGAGGAHHGLLRQVFGLHRPHLRRGRPGAAAVHGRGHRHHHGADLQAELGAPGRAAALALDRATRSTRPGMKFLFHTDGRYGQLPAA